MSKEIAIFHGIEIRKDAEGMINLTDLWKASGSETGKRPVEWLRQEQTIGFIKATAKILKVGENHLLKTTKGRHGSTKSHEQIALEYAQYLSPELAVLVNNTFLERIEEEKNPQLAVNRAVKSWEKQGKSEEWIAKRLKAVSTRKLLTGTLKAAGCDQNGYRLATNAMYAPQYGGDAGLVRKKLGIGEKANTREAMNEIQLGAIELTELIAAKNIEKKGLYGNNACVQECNTVSREIAKAIKSAMSNAA